MTMMRRGVQYVHRRQETSIPLLPTSGFTGAATLDASGAQTTEFVADNSASGGGQAVSPTRTFTITSASTPSATASETASSSGSSIALGAVVGICVGVFAGLAVLLLLFYYFGVRRLRGKAQRDRGNGGDAARQQSGRELWVKMEDADGSEKFSMKQSPIADKSGAAFERSITVKSGKSGKTFKSVGWGANLGLAETFRTPETAPQLEFTDSDMGTGHGFTRSASTAAAFIGEGKMAKDDKVPLSMRPSVNVNRVQNEPISWDGETAADGASYLSLERGSVSGGLKGKMPSPMSPSQSMVVSYQTPPAVETSLHQWEAAEVVSPGADGATDAYGGVESISSSEPTIAHPFASHYATSTARTSISEDTIRRPLIPFGDKNPFRSVVDDDRATISTIPPPDSAGSSNSFFSVQSSLPQRQGAFSVADATVAHHERMESNERAMASLIAALDITQEEARERMSAAGMPTPRASAMSSMTTSGMTGESWTSENGGIDEESMRKFPLPPADVQRHHAHA